MTEKKKMSVAEILAAARKKDGGGAASDAPGTAASDAPSAESTAPSTAGSEAAESSAPEPSASTASDAPSTAAPKAPAKPLAPGERPSVKDIMAMARAGKAAGAAPAAAKPAAKAPAEKPAAKPAAEKAKPAAKAAPAAPAKEKDTASILASARGGAKPGPITKAQAAAMPAAKPVAKAAPKEKIPVPPMPAKPAYAKPTPAKVAAAEQDRRTFLGYVFGSSLAIGMSAMAVTGGLWSLGFARFMFPNVLTEPPSRFKVGFKENFAPGQVETKFVATNGVWVVNGEYNGKPQVYALKTVCTHLGCTPNWLEAEQKFKCPCHGSGFYKDGINFEGPAPRPLERYAIRIAEDGQLEVDKSRTFQEEMGQWADPDSFVQV